MAGRRDNNRSFEEKKRPVITAGFIGCGIGMLAKSMQDAGITIAWGVDVLQDRLDDFKTNFPRAETFCEDIRLKDKFPPADIWAITLPCQCFSHCNQNRKEDPELIWRALYLVANVKPKLWFFENVMNAAIYFPRNITIKEMRACDYGNRQGRSRMFAGNFQLPLRTFTRKRTEATITTRGTGNHKYYGYRTPEQALEIQGYVGKGFTVTGSKRNRLMKIGEGVAYEVGYALGEAILHAK